MPPLVHGRSAAPAGPRPFALSIPSSREEMVEALRNSLHLSTPDMHGMYRESPPSSSASSCGQADPEDYGSEEDDALEPPVNATEWMGWINWEVVDSPMQLPRIDAMRVA